MPNPFDAVRKAFAGRYEIERELGSGGMATVYLARDLKHDRKVAIKILRPELAAALGPDRFPREIRIVAQLQHPHVLPLHDSGETAGFLYYVMPFVNGESLRAKLDRGGTPRMLVDWPGYAIGRNPVLSPDGATVIFASNRSGNFDLWSVPFAGGEPAPLATSPLDETSPQFSPDGSQVLFQSNRSGSQDLWVMPAAGGDARRLTDWPSDETNGRWSPDGSRIAFLSNHTGTGLDIWLVPSSGGDPTRLARFQATMSSVNWAKDGRSLFAIVTGSNGVNRLYRFPVAGGGPVALQMAPTGDAGVLSPDGTQYAYAALDSGWAFVEITPTAGGAPRRITRAADNVYDEPYAWSPDGTRLGVMSWLYGGNDATTNVTEVTVSDGAKRELTNFPHSYEQPVTYTRDGTRILFARAGIRSRGMSVRIGELLAREAAPSP